MNPLPPFGRSLAWAIRRRCPACGWGPLFDGWLKPRARCEECGLAADRGEQDFFLGALLLNFVGTELAVAGLVLIGIWLTWPAPPWTMLMVCGLGAAVTVPVLTYPVSRTVWLALDLRLRPLPGEDGSGPPLGVS